MELSGQARKLAVIGAKIAKNFQTLCLDETLERIGKVDAILRTFQENGIDGIADARAILPYTRIYAANVKSWGTTTPAQRQ